MKERSYHIAVFEPEVAGHPSAYIRLLYRTVYGLPDSFRVTFVVHPGICERLFLKEGVALRPEKGRTEFCYLDDSEVNACNHKCLAVRAFNRWRIMGHYARHLRVDHTLFMNLDLLQLPLAMGFKPGGKQTVSGILFQPSIHNLYRQKPAPLPERAKRLRKRLFYRAMLSNSCLDKVFSLDPYFAAEMKNRSRTGLKICHLPDPAPDILNEQTVEDCVPKALDLDHAERRLFLMFGSLTRRKGIFQLLSAIDALDDFTARRCSFIFAGQVAPDIGNELNLWLQKYRLRKTDAARIHLENRYLPDEDLLRLVKRADMVLAPYQRFVGASGVLLWAAAAGKPVLTADYGLVGALTRQYELGWTVDSRRPEEIRRALEAFCADPNGVARRTPGMARLIRGHAPSMFSRKMLAYFRYLAHQVAVTPDISVGSAP